MKKNYLYLIFLLILVSSVYASSPFQEHFDVIFPDDNECRINENIKSINDTIIIDGLKSLGYSSYGTCDEVGVYIKIDDTDCSYLGDSRPVFEKEVKDGKTICTTNFNQIFEEYCTEDYVLKKLGEKTNKNWHIEFGYSQKYNGPYIFKGDFKVLSEDDLQDKCNDYKAEKIEKTNSFLEIIGGIITLLAFVFSFIFTKRKKLFYFLEGIGLILLFLPSLIKFLS